MTRTILVFDSHPVQYRVPVWQAINTMHPNLIHVVYGSDCSVKGFVDEGFGKAFAWDEPMLEGYNHTILNCEKGKPLSGWGSLSGKGVAEQLDLLKPNYVLLTGLNYRYDWVALIEAKKRKIPVWLRCETQDFATTRPFWKSTIRSILYRTVYLFIDKFFYIGELNKQHYLKHGVSINKLFAARYATVDRFVNMSDEDKQLKRNETRAKATISMNNLVIGFSGKLIPKKNPDILYQAIRFLPEAIQKKISFYFIGSGELQAELDKAATHAKEQYGIDSFFAGFVNQSEIAAHYLAMDIMVLPSRRMGETWGLVANEALQAGCSVIVSGAVGCSADFKDFVKVEVFEVEDAKQLADCIVKLDTHNRNYNGAKDIEKDYSINSIANAIIGQT